MPCIHYLAWFSQQPVVMYMVMIPVYRWETAGLERLPGWSSDDAAGWGLTAGLSSSDLITIVYVPSENRVILPAVPLWDHPPGQPQSAVLSHTSWTGCGLSILFLCRCPGCSGDSLCHHTHTHAESLVRFSFLWFYIRQCHWRIIKTPDGFMLGPPDMVI